MSEQAETYQAESYPVSPDNHVERVRAKLLLRSQIGLKKYGVTTERDDLNLIDWCNHLQEELLDSAVYIERIKTDLQRLFSLTAHISHDPLYTLSSIESALKQQSLDIGDLEK